jgi:catechol 2,3-dioxygenase-like lactoylglutathione lyase family enzyme
MSAALGLNHLHLAVSDVDRAVRFYEQVFGLVERYRADSGIVYLRIPGTTHYLALRPDSNAGERVNRFGFTLSDPSDAGALVGRVLAGGGSLLRRRRLAPGVEEVVVADPDGNIISL